MAGAGGPETWRLSGLAAGGAVRAGACIQSGVLRTVNQRFRRSGLPKPGAMADDPAYNLAEGGGKMSHGSRRSVRRDEPRVGAFLGIHVRLCAEGC